MDEILYHLCRHAVGIMDGWHPYPAWAIAQSAEVSLSTARRRLRKLMAQGLARTFSEPPDPESEFTVPYHGWGITDKVYQTEEYKKACEAEKRILQEVFGDEDKEFKKIAQFVSICIGASGFQTKEGAIAALGVDDNE